MRLYHFVPAGFGLEDIGLRRLKVARLAELNDPFEFQGMVRRETLDQLVWDMGMHVLGEVFGILCFSDRWSNPVQWSHYADRHRGLCLGFDVAETTIHAVRYVSRPLPADHIKDLSPEKLKGDIATVQALLATKYSHWRYEHERRVVVRLPQADENGLCFIPFGQDLALREVILGAHCHWTRENVEAALGEGFPSPVRIVQADLAPSSFRVIRQRKPRTERSSSGYAQALMDLLKKHDGKLE